MSRLFTVLWSGVCLVSRRSCLQRGAPVLPARTKHADRSGQRSRDRPPDLAPVGCRDTAGAAPVPARRARHDSQRRTSQHVRRALATAPACPHHLRQLLRSRVPRPCHPRRRLASLRHVRHAHAQPAGAGNTAGATTAAPRLDLWQTAATTPCLRRQPPRLRHEEPPGVRPLCPPRQPRLSGSSVSFLHHASPEALLHRPRCSPLVAKWTRPGSLSV